MVSRKFFAASLLYVLPVSAGQFTFTGEGCIDPAGFDTCWTNANNAAASLSAKYCSGACTDADDCIAPDPNCGATVTCVAYEMWINCVLSHCWNRVYGCEYQNLAINAILNCPTADEFPPYIPAPRHAPGYCSCNMGYVFYNYKNAETEYNTCTNNVLESQAASTGSCYPYCYKDHTICECCASSIDVSTFFNSCPDTDPADVPIFSLLGYTGLQSSNCETNLTDSSTCSSSLFGYDIVAGPANGTDTLYLGNNIPANGTQPISNNPGGLASPTGAATFTWALVKGIPQTVTAVLTGSGAAATSTGSGAAATSSAGGEGSASTSVPGSEGSSGSTATGAAGGASSAGMPAPASTSAKAGMGGKVAVNVGRTFVVVALVISVLVV